VLLDGAGGARPLDWVFVAFQLSFFRRRGWL
jgi:hypothetical protein